MKRFLCILLILALTYSCSKKKEECESFKYGKFKVFFGEKQEESFYTLTRNQNEQVETDSRGNKVFYSVKWLSNCSYLAKYDTNKNEITDDMKMVNADGGIVVILENENVKGKCIKYTSYVKNYENASKQKGFFCK